MKPVANSKISDEVPIGSRWQTLPGCRFSVSMGDITVKSISSLGIHYMYGHTVSCPDFFMDKPTFLKYARRVT